MTQTTPNHKLIVSGWAAHDSDGVITPYTFKRRVNGANDVSIKIWYCGMDHTDIHFAKNHWGITRYPVVPGYEITGLITDVGSNVKGFKIGDRVGVGCIGASCLECEFCTDSQENYCDQVQFTYNGVFWDGSVMYGGYSEMLVADHRYVVHMPESLPMDAVAPLLCAGITVYAPMIDNKLHERLAIMYQLLAPPLQKRKRPGKSKKRTLDFILDTVSGPHSLGPILELLKVNGTLVLLSVPDKPVELPSFPLILGKRVVKGSMLGGMKEMNHSVMYLRDQVIHGTRIEGTECTPIKALNHPCSNNAVQEADKLIRKFYSLQEISSGLLSSEHADE
ncbi:probable cinnamyl alcohol dehydrogenase 6 [Tanacetum coccineum]